VAGSRPPRTVGTVSQTADPLERRDGTGRRLCRRCKRQPGAKRRRGRLCGFTGRPPGGRRRANALGGRLRAVMAVAMGLS